MPRSAPAGAEQQEFTEGVHRRELRILQDREQHFPQFGTAHVVPLSHRTSNLRVEQLGAASVVCGKMAETVFSVPDYLVQTRAACWSFCCGVSLRTGSRHPEGWSGKRVRRWSIFTSPSAAATEQVTRRFEHRRPSSSSSLPAESATLRRHQGVCVPLAARMTVQKACEEHGAVQSREGRTRLWHSLS